MRVRLSIRNHHRVTDCVSYLFRQSFSVVKRHAVSHQYSPNRSRFDDPRVFELFAQRGLEGFGASPSREGAGLNRVSLDRIFGALLFRFWILKRFGWWRGDDLYSDTGSARSDHVDLLRGGKREIDDSSFDERTAIGDANLHSFSVIEIVHFDPGSEGERSMSGSELLHVVDLAGCGAPPVVWLAVPACDSGFGVADFRRRRNSRGGSASTTRRGEQHREAKRGGENFLAEVHRTRMIRAPEH